MTLAALFISASINFQLPEGLLQSLCFIESSHNISAIHVDDGGSDSLGTCQIKLSTAQHLGFQGTEKELMTPAVNIWYSAKYLKYQLKRYGNNIPKALTAYNRGNAKGLTRSSYSDKVISHWETYQNESGRFAKNDGI